MNTNNFAIVRGRLIADPIVFTNGDGSSKIKFTIASENNFKNKDGERETQFIPVEAYAKEYAKSPFARIHKGDKVSVEAMLKNNNYTNKNGEEVYSTVVFVNSIQFDESKSVTEARAAENAAKAAAAAAENAAKAAAVPATPAQD